MKKIEIMPVVKDGVTLAMRNYLSILGAVVLYVLTIWIPYLNVGTTIAMSALPAEMAKGNIINPTFIFESRFRRRMGEFFIMEAIMMSAIGIGYAFLVIPGLVLGIAWSLAAILFIDKDRGALESLRESNELTYGNKWRIVGANCIVAIGLIIAVSGIALIFGAINLDWLGSILNLIIILFAMPCLLGVQAIIYKQLTDPEAAPIVEEPIAEEPVKEAPAKKAPAKKAAPKE